MTALGVINVLDKHVAELIAAGEVVERPASVIKNITVEIKNGGTTFMRVTDDGCGIARDDVKVAFLRHATSKVKYENDLNNISTLGFRGEALASISAVSKLQLITRNVSEDVGTSYIIEGGEEISLDDAGCPVGTTFIIRDLFYNIPARAKFLKKDVSEGISVSNIVDKTALSHPEIAFTYIRDGKLLSSIYSVFGREFANGLIPVDYELNSVKISGYVSKPVHSRPNRNMQNFFINGRYVKSRTAMAAIEEAFKGSIMVGKFPSCVLNITVPFEVIDVNVHPAKIEVRFVNERPVFDAVYHGVKSSLLKNDNKKQVTFKNNTAFNDIKKFNPFTSGGYIIQKEEKAKAKITPEKKPVQPQPKSDIISELDIKPDIDNLRVSDNDNPFEIYSKQAVRNEKLKEQKIEEFKAKAREEKQIPLIDPDFEEETIEAEPETDFVQQKLDIENNSELTVTENHNSIPTLLDEQEDEIKYIGELFDTYIIVEKNKKEMILIDKHAAHERIIYEKLKAEKAGASAQILLQPVTVTLGKNEYDAAINNLQMFSDCSFDVEDFGNSTVIVRSAPQYIDAAEIPDCITEMAGYIAQGKTDIYTEKMDWFYANVACRSAVKAGNRNSADELIELIKTLEKNPQIRYCPHGRPVWQGVII